MPEIGGTKQRSKMCLVLDRERYRYQTYLSDIAGNDIEAHAGDPKVAVKRVRDRLRTASARSTIPGGARIWKRYERFQLELPSLCDAIGVDETDLAFADYSNTIVQWLKENAPRSPARELLAAR